MKLNYETCIVGKSCFLVPYRPEHVHRYHVWMQDPSILEATGSEIMTLDQELENQQSWRDDDTKCTFIVLARDLCSFVDGHSVSASSAEPPFNPDPDFVIRNLHAMVGDVNLFFSNLEPGEDDDRDPFLSLDPQQQSHHPSQQHNMLQAEVDVMIAEPAYRGQGLGREATLLIMLFAAKHFHSMLRFFCKVNHDNHASRCLFQKNLGFVEKNYAAVFRQYEYELARDTNEELVLYLINLLGIELETFPTPLAHVAVTASDAKVNILEQH